VRVVRMTVHVFSIADIEIEPESYFADID
jgi:hypothetical protein